MAAVAAGHAPAPNLTNAAIDVEILEAPTAPAPELPVDPMTAPAPTPRAAPAVAAPTHVHPYPTPPSHDHTPHDPSLVHAPFAPPVPAHEEHDHAHDEPAPAAPALAAPAATPTFTITMGSAQAYRGGATSANGTGEKPSDEPIPEALVSSPAQPLYAFKPPYPGAARAEGVEATVTVEIIIEVDGSVREAHVVRKAGFGFDEAALTAVRQFRFTPARKDGRAVRERKRSTFEFRLQ
jgi:protein TonB